MDRRTFVQSSGAVLLAAPLAAQAQQAGKISRIGFLFYGAPGPSPELEAFRQGLRDLGYIEGQNVSLEYRFADGRVGRLPELAAELARLELDVIVTPGTPASLAAKKATTASKAAQRKKVASAKASKAAAARATDRPRTAAGKARVAVTKASRESAAAKRRGQPAADTTPPAGDSPETTPEA